MDRTIIVKAKTRLMDYNNKLIEIIGSAEIECCEIPSGRIRVIQFFVATNKHEPNLSLQTSVALGFISRVDSINRHTALPLTLSVMISFIKVSWR